MDKRIKDMSKIKVLYDDTVDVLYVSFEGNRPGIAMELDDGDFVRVDPYTDEIVGITILDFNDRFASSIEEDVEKSTKLIVSNILNEYSRRASQRAVSNLI